MFSNNKILSALFLFLFLGFCNIFAMKKDSQQESESPKVTVEILKKEFLRAVDLALSNITEEELPSLKEDFKKMLRENLESSVNSEHEKEALEKFIEQFDELWEEKTANFTQDISAAVAQRLNFYDNEKSFNQKIMYASCSLLTILFAFVLVNYNFLK